VAIPHGALSNLIDWHHSDVRLGKPARTVQFAAAVFDVSLQEIFTTLTVGGCLVLPDDETRGDPRLLWKLIVEQKVERVFLPSVALEQLALSGIAADTTAGAYLLDIVSAGEKLALTEPIRELLRALPNCRLHNHYGPTESHVVSAHVVGDSPTLQPEGVSIGKPIGNALIRILDPAGRRCPVGVPGELHIGGRSLARGYLNNPELTTEKFIADPFCPSVNRRLYRSGDLASWNADGTRMPARMHGEEMRCVAVGVLRIIHILQPFLELAPFADGWTEKLVAHGRDLLLQGLGVSFGIDD
jgi:non-ribosomal peptide synthetase component F